MKYVCMFVYTKDLHIYNINQLVLQDRNQQDYFYKLKKKCIC